MSCHGLSEVIYAICCAAITDKIDDNPFNFGDDALRKAYKGFPGQVRQVCKDVQALIYKCSPCLLSDHAQPQSCTDLAEQSHVSVHAQSISQSCCYITI